VSDKEGAQRDARIEHANGCYIPAAEARKRAQVWREGGHGTRADYWDAYATEVESWFAS
jgi:hypothetical protein